MSYQCHEAAGAPWRARLGDAMLLTIFHEMYDPRPLAHHVQLN